MPTLIEVTQADIDKALDLEENHNETWSISDYCPVSIAATRAFGTPMRVVDPGVNEAGEAEELELHFKSRGFDQTGNLLLPDEAVDRVNTYDIERRMDPFSFEVKA